MGMGMPVLRRRLLEICLNRNLSTHCSTKRHRPIIDNPVKNLYAITSLAEHTRLI